jgi:putative ABC transport system permease protein
MRAYRLLLLAFPRRVRREDGDEMARMFAEQMEAARAAGGSVVRLWIAAAVDACVHGGTLRLEPARARAGRCVSELRRWRWWMYAVIQDVKHAGRMLVRQPALSTVALLTLALGIGANTAIYSAVDAVLLRPLPYHEPARLVMVWEKRAAEGVFNNVVAPADYLDWARLNQVFESIAAVMPVATDLTGSGEPVRLPTLLVSAPFFDVLRVRPALGRTFVSGEDQPGRHGVVILSHSLWLERFGADAGIVGRQLLLNGTAHEVIGVLAPTFAYPDATIRLFAPLVLQGGSQPPSRANHELQVYARLASGVSLQQARDGMDRVAAHLSAEYPQTNQRHGAWVSLLSDEATAPARGGLLLLLGAVAFVLLIACVNVANLLLTQAAARQREMAVRTALGAGRARLAGQALTESLLLGVLGGGAGLLVASGGIVLLRQVLPEGLPVVGLQRIALDGRVLLFCLFLSIVTGLLFGLLPAWHSARVPAQDVLRESGRSPSAVRRRLRASLVVSEIALASLLLVGAGLTLRSFQALLRTEPGFDAGGVLTASVALPGARYAGPGRVPLAVDAMEQRFRAIPGVRAVGATTHLPLSGADSRRGVGIEGRTPPSNEPTRAHWRSVTPGYFEAMGLRIVEGRALASTDRADTPPVVVINETMARRYWPGLSPVGRRMSLSGSPGTLEVVGIVRDVRHWGVDGPVNPEMYFAFPQAPVGRLAFTLATDGDPAAFAGAVREALRGIDPDLPLSSVRTMVEVTARSMAGPRATMMLLAVFGTLALVLAAAGIYGVTSHLVAMRTAEIGVRMSLGARPRDVLRLVLADGLIQGVAGLAVGLTAGVLLMRSFRALLYQIEPADPITLAAVAAVLLATVLVACLLPARRAMRVDPVSAMRH